MKPLRFLAWGDDPKIPYQLPAWGMSVGMDGKRGERLHVLVGDLQGYWMTLCGTTVRSASQPDTGEQFCQRCYELIHRFKHERWAGVAAE